MLAALPRARDRLLYRLVLSDIPALPGATSDTPQHRDCCEGRRDAALGLALCAYLLYTTNFIVHFHLEQSQGNGYIADNKRVYVVARRLEPPAR